MPFAWRLIKQKYAATAFTGEGAARSGGRWNSRNRLMIYTSQSLSLAALETLVHLVPPMLSVYRSIQVEIDEGLLDSLMVEDLPDDWRAYPSPRSCQIIGDEWLDQRRSAVLRVPSVLVPAESNFLLNPMHPDFAKIKISPPESFAFDQRFAR